MTLEKHAEKIVRFEKLRRKLKTSFNDGVDRHLANLVHEEHSDLEDFETKEQIVLSSLDLLIKKTIKDPKSFTNSEQTRGQYEEEVQKIESNGIHPTGPLHIPDGFLPEWYLHTSPLSQEYKMFVERHKKKILRLRILK